MTFYDMLAWAGFYTNKMYPHTDGFWSSPVGITISFVVFVCAVINVFHRGIDDNWFDRIWYCTIAIVMFCAFLVGISPDSDPKNIVRTVLFLLAVKMPVDTIVRLIRFRKTGRCQKTL